MSSLRELQELVHEKFGIAPEAIDVNTPMRESGLDSLALAELMFEVEDRLHVTLTEEHNDVQTLAELATLVDKLRAPQTQQA